MALSIGFRIFSFPPSCYSSYGALNFYPDGTFTHCSCQPSLDAHFPVLTSPALYESPTIRSTTHIPITDFPVPNFQNTHCPWTCLIFFNPACQLVTTVNTSGPRASADDYTTRMEKELTHPERGDMTFAP